MKAGRTVPFNSGYMPVTAEQVFNPAKHLEGVLSRFAGIEVVPRKKGSESNRRINEDQAEHYSMIDAGHSNADVWVNSSITLLQSGFLTTLARRLVEAGYQAHRFGAPLYAPFL